MRSKQVLLKCLLLYLLPLSISCIQPEDPYFTLANYYLESYLRSPNIDFEDVIIPESLHIHVGQQRIAKYCVPNDVNNAKDGDYTIVITVDGKTLAELNLYILTSCFKGRGYHVMDKDGNEFNLRNVDRVVIIGIDKSNGPKEKK